MKKFLLTRSYLADKTVGKLTSKEFTACTLERPWLNNRQDVSCIPEGVYLVKRDKYGRHQWYAVQDVEGRSFIELHIANKVEDLQGCIGLGLGFTDQYNLLSSKRALESLLECVGDNDFLLHIRAATKDDW